MKGQLKRFAVFALALTFLLMAVGCSPAQTAQGKDPESVLKAVTEALNKKDVDNATALLADDIVQTLIPAPSGTGIYKRKETMRARFKEVVALNAYHKFGKCETSGDKVTCAATYSDNSTKPLGFDLEFTVDAVVQNGLLKTVTWKMTDASLAKIQAAMANAQPQPMTVTFAGGKCAYAGPKKVSVGKITVNLNVEGQGNVGYGLFMATLDKGKTIDDLIPVPALPQPDWVHEVDKVGPFSGSRTMTTLAEVKEGPIYLVCFTFDPLTKIGALGPIEVVGK